jgi:DNA-binding response OmpR family regulator
VQADHSSFIALVDDDPYSAHLLVRTVAAESGPTVEHFGDANEGETGLIVLLSDVQADWPGVVIVDLKAHSRANLDFLARNQALLRTKGIPLAVMTQPTDRAGRQRLHDAGASAVFFRQAERDAYRREAAAIIGFWARHQRLDAVGM